MSTLILHVKGVYFRDIAAGTKGDEYRLCTPHWTKRLVGKVYDEIEIRWGYPANHQLDRIMSFNWNGYRRIRLTHPHFGPNEVEVFAIDLSERIA